MRPAHWKMMGVISVVLGLIFLIGGAWIWLNVLGYMGWGGLLQYWEYGGYVIPLWIVGGSLCVVGYAFFLMERVEERKPHA